MFRLQPELAIKTLDVRKTHYNCKRTYCNADFPTTIKTSLSTSSCMNYGRKKKRNCQLDLSKQQPVFRRADGSLDQGVRARKLIKTNSAFVSGDGDPLFSSAPPPSCQPVLLPQGDGKSKERNKKKRKTERKKENKERKKETVSWISYGQRVFQWTNGSPGQGRETALVTQN